MLLDPDAVVPSPPGTAELHLEPLQEHHNASDLAAWGASIDHIRVTPGMTGREWPPDVPFSLEQNLADMQRHAADFAARTGFTWSVLDPASREVIGCVYLYPPEGGGREGEVQVRSWVRADRAHLDSELWKLVTEWLARDWPWTDIDYAAR